MNEKLQVYDTKMQKTLHSLDAELATIRAGRANPHILDKLTWNVVHEAFDKQSSDLC